LAATTRLECIRFSVSALYRYGRPQFLRSFSTRELFADFDRVDAEWLDTLIKGANPASRYAVFSFYLGFGDRTTRRLLPLLLNRRSWL